MPFYKEELCKTCTKRCFFDTSGMLMFTVYHISRRSASGNRNKMSSEKHKKKKRFLKKGLTKGTVCAIISNANRKDASLLVLPAGVAEQADARDLKSRDARASYRFDPGHRHQGTE